MANFVLLIAVLLAASSFVSFTAQDVAAAGYGENWASRFLLWPHRSPVRARIKWPISRPDSPGYGS